MAWQGCGIENPPQERIRRSRTIKEAKAYRNTDLDERIRRSRTIKEAQSISRATPTAHSGSEKSLHYTGFSALDAQKECRICSYTIWNLPLRIVLERLSSTGEDIAPMLQRWHVKKLTC